MEHFSECSPPGLDERPASQGLGDWVHPHNVAVEVRGDDRVPDARERGSEAPSLSRSASSAPLRTTTSAASSRVRSMTRFLQLVARLRERGRLGLDLVGHPV